MWWQESGAGTGLWQMMTGFDTIPYDVTHRNTPQRTTIPNMCVLAKLRVGFLHRLAVLPDSVE